VRRKGEEAGPVGIVSEVFVADENCGVEWLTSPYSLIAAQGNP